MMFYESFHYINKVGDMIIDNIFNGQTKKHSCSDFGVYVTEFNINSHISCLARQKAIK